MPFPRAIEVFHTNTDNESGRYHSSTYLALFFAERFYGLFLTWFDKAPATY